MFGKVKTENLPTYLEKITKYFPEFQQEKVPDTEDIKRYYSESFWGYAIFHSWAGAIHMALSPSGLFSKNDYFRQAEEIASYLVDVPERRVIVEIGCGKAFNIRYLAERFPKLTFKGLDISERNLIAAKRQLEGLSNTSLALDDFHSLSSTESGSVDLLFAVESLCHAQDLDSALQSVARVLKPNSKFVVFDGYRADSFDASEQIRTAVGYAERAMAVPRFRALSEFISSAQKQGLILEKSDDRSEQIMPNLVRLSDLAKAFFKIGPLSRLLLATLPRGLVANSIAGLLMAVTVKSGAHRYMRLVFTRAATTDSMV
jgi:arsenite methyltransferase